MGTGIHGGFGNTEGGLNAATLQTTAEENKSKIVPLETIIEESKSESISLETALISELERNGVMFTKEDIIFITKDRTGQTVWLEKGNAFAGLEHILNGDGKSPGHATDFENAFGITKNELPSYLQEIITHGQIVSNSIITRGGREGYERVYYYEGNYHVVTGIGKNGFIVSAYPRRKG